MTEHPDARGISFTASIARGTKVNATAAAHVRRMLLELGGSDPAIILGEVDPEQVADVLVGRAFMNAGQICMAVTRVDVPELMHDALVRALVRRAEAIIVGNGRDDGVEMGPINSRPQFERVQALVAEAIDVGARVVAGGRPLERPGFFFAPTILTGVAEGTRVVDEEQFGPVLPVMAYHGVAKAIERANATNGGLGASLWSNDPERAQAVAERLEAGNDVDRTHAVVSHGQPF